jgi:predicted aldo/keto reductase-like oxidoreductase
LKWVLQDTNVHATIPGFSTFDELETDLSVMDDLSLNDAERLDLEREASGPGMFCQGCGQCLWDCDAQLPIPDLMRAYMYAYGYRQPALAHSVIASLELPRRTCEDCETCTVVCANGWNVAEKIRDLQRLQGVLA